MSFVQYNPYATDWWEWDVHSSEEPGFMEAIPKFSGKGTEGELPVILTQEKLARTVSNAAHSGQTMHIADVSYEDAWLDSTSISSSRSSINPIMKTCVL